MCNAIISRLWWQPTISLINLCNASALFPDIFSLISDSAGIMVHSQFDQFLREALKLPMAVFEGPSFGYTEQAARTCFAQQVRVWRPQHFDVSKCVIALALTVWVNLTLLCAARQ